MIVTLFDECMQAVGDGVKIVERKQEGKISSLFEILFPFYGSVIDWEKIDKKVRLNSIDKIIKSISQLVPNPDYKTFALWNDAGVPILKADLKKFISVIDVISVLGTRTWFFCPISRYVVEFHHEEAITIGVAPSLYIRLNELYDKLFQFETRKLFLEHNALVPEIVTVGNKIEILAKKIIDREALSDEEKLIIEKEYLTKSAWRPAYGNPYPLIKSPTTLEYAKNIRNLQEQCKSVLLYEEVLKL